MYIIEGKNMKEINNLLSSLYKGDNESATIAFNNALESKKAEALEVKKVAVASNIYNTQNTKG